MDEMQDSGRAVEAPAHSDGRIRVLIVDPYPIFRRGLCEIMQAEPDLEPCAETDNTRDAARLLAEKQPDILVLDVCLPGESGLSFLESVGATWRTVVFSMYDEGSYADRVLRAGARAYVAKHQPAEHLLSAIREVHARRVEDGARGACAKCGARGEPASPLAALSNREMEVFRIMGQGLPIRMIADRLHLSPKTVESHRENIKKKLGVKTSNELLMRAMFWAMAQSDLPEGSTPSGAPDAWTARTGERAAG